MTKHPASVLIAPRITEKAALLAERGCYVFNVSRDAAAADVSRAVAAVYKVTPRKVTLAAVPSKRVRTRGSNRMGRTAAGKKAYVYLKPGETIEII